MNAVMTFNNVQNMFNKDQINNNTIILPLPKLTSPSSNQQTPTQQQQHPQPIHPQHPHNSLWDYKFGSTSIPNTRINSPSTSPSIESGILSTSSSTIQIPTSSYTLHTPIPHQPALLLPSINTLSNQSSSTFSPIEEHYSLPLQTRLNSPTSRSQSLPINHHSSITNTSSKITKPQPRKKKQCPECHLFFSNLSTHKSIHLTPENRPYLCKICGRGFARSNDLFRHNKRHWKETGSSQGAFKCPFNSILYQKTHPHPHTHNSDEFEETPCHPTGIFSRCDTYKNHLKALHFNYPPGTKKKQRNEVPGNCKKCGKWFENVDVWLNLHIENNECGWNFDDINN
ncbi:Zinc finger protein [Wickerhamomyces ciferrii]|uniref:Zinc finger protein n=1 Tax=Wickerhamomyces ciferrii (strain ATCC 14091 / BCRC 22168 / CBS 111 / JCM 3599 / NBRC 0793 / NRRL Y-1031 F-60-10) TaxID=1206466 RepID=K0KY65_WICCF|nr:Zinc finger protein [Wickerhamomyces ciferrii]CCH47017.1 Zinc finger protein [Wickerhamomyces ciferrii]